jgi:hypothetical protein
VGDISSRVKDKVEQLEELEKIRKLAEQSMKTLVEKDTVIERHDKVAKKLKEKMKQQSY